MSQPNNTELKAKKNMQKRELAIQLTAHEISLWKDEDVALLLQELEIEIGEGTNRFIYNNERMHYCTYLSQNIAFNQDKSPEDINDKIVWLWTTWEAISRATGKSWWKITEAERQKLSLQKDNPDQQLISRFKYYNDCDKIFSYIKEDYGEMDDDQLSADEASIYFN